MNKKKDKEIHDLIKQFLLKDDEEKAKQQFALVKERKIWLAITSVVCFVWPLIFLFSKNFFTNTHSFMTINISAEIRLLFIVFIEIAVLFITRFLFSRINTCILHLYSKSNLSEEKITELRDFVNIETERNTLKQQIVIEPQIKVNQPRL